MGAVVAIGKQRRHLKFLDFSGLATRRCQRARHETQVGDACVTGNTVDQFDRVCGRNGRVVRLETEEFFLQLI